MCTPCGRPCEEAEVAGNRCNGTCPLVGIAAQWLGEVKGDMQSGHVGRKDPVSTMAFLGEGDERLLGRRAGAFGFQASLGHGKSAVTNGLTKAAQIQWISRLPCRGPAVALLLQQDNLQWTHMIHWKVHPPKYPI